MKPRTRYKRLMSPEMILSLSLATHHFPTYETQYRFHKDRRWRFDFAFVKKKIAAECEGGTWSHGRHVRGQGFEDDCTKYNEAALQGWRVFRFTTQMVEKGIATETLAHAIWGEKK